MSERSLYIFLDEGGNFDFSQGGTNYFTLTGLSTMRPFDWYNPFTEIKYDLIQSHSLDLECFHAAEDKQFVRDKIFKALGQCLDRMHIDSVIVEKRKTGPALQSPERFYPRMIGYLLQYIFKRYDFKHFSKFIIVTDRLPFERKREAIKKAIKAELASCIPKDKTYTILHHASMSCFGLQAVDYCNWAIFRKWERRDTRSYDLIDQGIKSEFDIFKTGTRYYY